ncbi:hypothetical protein BU15DRAFT_65042 [Melanogaster broomeanus]|nr:hypothetical protein BU15DRAFT_65042 [Melanogaster broomeanus]
MGKSVPGPSRIKWNSQHVVGAFTQALLLLPFARKLNYIRSTAIDHLVGRNCVSLFTVVYLEQNTIGTGLQQIQLQVCQDQHFALGSIHLTGPNSMYVVAAIAGVAAVLAFKEFVYEPHIAPALESWAENFLERRRTARNRRASAVPVSRRDRRNSSSSSSQSNQGSLSRHGRERPSGQNDLAAESYELEGLVAREVDEWRNEVLRSQEITREGLRKRGTARPRDEFDSFDGMTMSFDESFTSLSRTPLAPTHIISNVSSPTTFSTLSLPLTPSRRLRSQSQSTTTQGDVNSLFIVPSLPPSPIHESPKTSRTESEVLSSAELWPSLPTDCNPGITDNPTPLSPPAPLTIPQSSHQDSPTRSSPSSSFTHSANKSSSPLPFTPTYQGLADDSPFGPLLPDTPRSSAEMYGERPFSPIARILSPSGPVSVHGSRGALSSRTNSMNSIRTIGNAGRLRRGSGLVNEAAGSSSEDDGEVEEDDTSTFDLMGGTGVNGSVISSLSERYPAPPTPPVVVSPPASSVGIISAPSSPQSWGSEGLIDSDEVLPTGPQPRPQPPTLSLPSMLQVPSDARSGSHLRSRSHSPGLSATSPALSFTSFLSPMSASRAVSESEGDEFMSVADGDSDWSPSPVPPSADTGRGLVSHRPYDPFLDFEDMMSDSEGSDDAGVLEHANRSEEGSEESWGSARRH